LTEIDIREDYIDAIADDIVVAQPLRVVVDCGNGIAGEIAPDIFMSLGCEVIPLYCDVDGNFPNHHPDPTVAANLADLILTVKSQQADIGIALDGDGDRLVAVTGSGEIVSPDLLLMLFAKDVVSRNPGSDVVYDVKCTRHLNSIISGFGGRPIICRSGHSYLKQKMTETDAVLGGEFSGHICFKERWYGFDDGLYASARLLEIVGSQTASLDQLMAEFPQTVSTPEIQIPVSDSVKFRIVDALIDSNQFDDGSISLIDGIRVDYSDGWGLVRASNTSPCLTLRFEADDTTSLHRIQNLFRENLLSIDEGLQF
jgi:phosphomannomutase/phosphoglucomutase